MTRIIPPYSIPPDVVAERLSCLKRVVRNVPMAWPTQVNRKHSVMITYSLHASVVKFGALINPAAKTAYAALSTPNMLVV